MNQPQFLRQSRVNEGVSQESPSLELLNLDTNKNNKRAAEKCCIICCVTQAHRWRWQPRPSDRVKGREEEQQQQQRDKNMCANIINEDGRGVFFLLAIVGNNVWSWQSWARGQMMLLKAPKRCDVRRMKILVLSEWREADFMVR